MKISTKGRYALRLMLDIAINGQNGLVSIKDISARQGISGKYLEQIISILNTNGFVKSVRGAQGGYFLTKEPKDYTVGMILSKTEGTLAPVFCVENDSQPCDRIDCCATYVVWQKLNDAIHSVVDNITLEDLINYQKDGENKQNSLNS